MVVKGPFHPGEVAMQRCAGLLDEAQRVGRGIATTLPRGATRFLARQRLAVAASLDADGRVWASLLCGPAGFIRRVDERLLHLATPPSGSDPLAANLCARPELGLLVLDPATRQRMRFNGRGLLSPEGVFLLVDQAYGNCPKYIQSRRFEADDAAGAPVPTQVTASLDARQQAALASADTLFIASFHPEGGADASHRGGFPGFLRVLGPNLIGFDDYPGNGMFNTLGNLREYPRAGLLFVDFATGDLLQATGRAEVGPGFSVTFRVDEVRATPAGSPLRYAFVAYSPANPPVSQEATGGISSTELDESSGRTTR